MSQVPVYFVLSLPSIGAYTLLALGVVVIFRASRVLNLAHGAIVMVPPFLLFELSQRGLPLVPSLVVALAAGAGFGALIERVFVRGLRAQGPTGQTVGTVAALGLVVAAAVKVWGTAPRGAIAVFPTGSIPVGASQFSYGQIGLVVVAIAATAVLFAVFAFTNLGLAMRLAADNRRAASLMGVDPDATTRTAWMLGGALAALAGVLLAPTTTLHPVNLSLLVLPAFVAALIGGLGSMPGAMVGAVVVGLAQGMVPALGLIPWVGELAKQQGAPQLVLTIVALAVMVLRGTRFTGSDVRAEGEIAAAAASADDEGRDAFEDDLDRPHVARSLGRLVLVAALLVWPFLGVDTSYMATAIKACGFVIVAASLVLLTGWVGQISLAQASFVGIGAFVTAIASNHWHVPFPLSLPIAAIVAGLAAALLGVVALRVRGLYLAVATLIFLWMCGDYLFTASWFTGGGSSASILPQSIGKPDQVPYLDFSDRRTFYFVALAVAGATLWGLANLRDSKTGRAFFAVRGSELAAASLGIDLTRYKLTAFAIAGLLAGVAGNLVMIHTGAVLSDEFGVTASLLFLAVAVVGGLTSLGGAVAAGILIASLDELFYRVSFFSGWLDVVSALLLVVVLLGRPGGLASIPALFRPALRTIRRPLRPYTRALGRGLDAAYLAATRPAGRFAGLVVASLGFAGGKDDDEGVVPAEPAASGDGRARAAARRPRQRSRRTAVLEAQGVTVQFGGLVAVDNVSLRVCEGEIVGLIGPNGAGKTTTFNSISGLNVPTAGTVSLFGQDVTDLQPHARAALGLGRTFQVIQLFPQLSVYDNLLVATHLQNDSGVLSHIVVSRPSLEAEHAARRRVAEVIEFLDLGDLAHRQVAGLPFGQLRMVEVARALVTGAPLIMLDEPASGLDNAETERLADLIRYIRDERGVSILLIEHDVAMVTGVSDYMYVVNRGKLIAEGTPADVQRNEDVIAAYLGRPAHDEAVPA
jgi:sulfate-transporting ATPase